jgi:RecA/RadA recombinase
VDIDNLLISQPDNGEQALEIADTLIRSGAIGLVVIDSVAAFGSARGSRRRNGRRDRRFDGAHDEPGLPQIGVDGGTHLAQR